MVMMMNKDRVLELAEMLRAQRFPGRITMLDMRQWYRESWRYTDMNAELDGEANLCGTSACAAGIVVAKWGWHSQEHLSTGALDWFREAQALLGLGYVDAVKLFLIATTATADQVAETLERFAETGEVVWTHIPDSVVEGQVASFLQAHEEEEEE